MADRFGARRMTLAGLIALGLGCFTLSALPRTFGIAGYLAPMVIITLGYAVFQTANNTVMSNVAPDRRGLVSALLNLSRNLGLITGRLGAGRGVCAGIEFDRHQCRASRGGCQRHARDVHGGMGTDRDCVFDRPGQPTRRTGLSRRRAGRHGVARPSLSARAGWS
jgi:hypothetical protein